MSLQTLNRIHILQEIYQQDYHSDIADRILDKLIALEREKAEDEFAEFASILESFEKRYQMSSEIFYKKFKSGEIGDDIDYFEWSAMYTMYKTIQERLLKLSRIHIQ